MENVLNLYHEPYDPHRPVVCFDESNKELLTRSATRSRLGRERSIGMTTPTNGMARSLFVMSEPLTGWRHIEVTKRRRKQEFIQQMQSLVVDHYSNADCVGW